MQFNPLAHYLAAQNPRRRRRAPALWWSVDEIVGVCIIAAFLVVFIPVYAEVFLRWIFHQ